MSVWLGYLNPIAAQLVASARGQPDLQFWDTICHRSGGGSGPDYLCGWITAFSVFDNNEEGRPYPMGCSLNTNAPSTTLKLKGSLS